jgi:hypothetical protein
MAGGRDQVGRERTALERDPEGLDRRVRQRQRLVESGDLPAEGCEQTRIDRLAVDRMVRRRIRATGSEEQLAGAAPPALGQGRVRFARATAMTSPKSAPP